MSRNYIEIMKITLCRMGDLLINTKTLSTQVFSSFRALSGAHSLYNSSLLRTGCLSRLPWASRYMKSSPNNSYSHAKKSKVACETGRLRATDLIFGMGHALTYVRMIFSTDFFHFGFFMPIQVTF